jgi:hypothetical protein
MSKYRGQIFIIGEGFRTPIDPQSPNFVGVSDRLVSNRGEGLPESIPGQEEACKSHVNFLDHFKNEIDFNVDIITYPTPVNHLIKEWYKDYSVDYTELESLIGWDNLFKLSVQNLKSKEYLNELDFVFVFRIDLFFKPEMLKAFRYKSNCVLYPSILWKILPPPSDGSRWLFPNDPVGGRLKVSDLFVFIPKARFSELFDGQIKLNHIALFDMSEELYNNTSYFLNTYHDSDSEKDWNPIYRIVNKPESSIWYSEGHIIEHGLSDFNNNSI